MTDLFIVQFYTVWEDVARPHYTLLGIYTTEMQANVAVGAHAETHCYVTDINETIPGADVNVPRATTVIEAWRWAILPNTPPDAIRSAGYVVCRVPADTPLW